MGESSVRKTNSSHQNSYYITCRADIYIYDYDFDRYLGQNENTEINEKCYDLELDIEDAEERNQKANEKSGAVSNIDKRVKTGLHQLGNALSITFPYPN